MSDTNSPTAGNTPDTGSAQPVAEPTLIGEAQQAASAASGDATPSQQAPEGQPAPPDKGDAATTDGDTKPSDSITGAPETYDFKPPEGNKFDAEVIDAFSTVAKELDLSQGAAQKILDTLAPKVAERFAAAQAQALETWKADMAAETKADKELGGDKLSENLAVAEKALAAFGSPKLRELLVTSGLGNNPEIIRAFYKAGKAISEDKFVPGGTAPSKGEVTAAKRLYPDQSN